MLIWQEGGSPFGSGRPDRLCHLSTKSFATAITVTLYSMGKLLMSNLRYNLMSSYNKPDLHATFARGLLLFMWGCERN